MLDDSDFVNHLAFPELIEEYRKEKKLLLKTIEQKYETEKKYNVDKKNEGIKQDQNHRMILNACIFPFAQDDSIQRYGYTLLKASPLSELGGPNMDFLLYHPDTNPKLIFGEAKGQVEDHGRVTDQMKERIVVVERNSEYVKTQYLRNTNYTADYVIGVGWPNGNNMMKSVLRKGGRIKVWEVGIDITENKETLTLVAPAKEDGEIAKTMLHEKEFSRILSNLATSSDFKSVFIESHPFAKLSLLTIIRDDKDGFFYFADFLELVRREFDYLEGEEIYNIAKEILDLAIKIGYVELPEKELTSNNKGRYRLSTRKKKAQSREMELKKKWIDFAIAKDKQNEIVQRLTELQGRIAEKRSKSKTILELIEESNKPADESKHSETKEQ